MVPKTMRFTAAPGVTFQAMEDPRQPDALVRVMSNTRVDQPLNFSLSGTGTLNDLGDDSQGRPHPVGMRPSLRPRFPRWWRIKLSRRHIQSGTKISLVHPWRLAFSAGRRRRLLYEAFSDHDRRPLWRFWPAGAQPPICPTQTFQPFRPPVQRAQE